MQGVELLRHPLIAQVGVVAVNGVLVNGEVVCDFEIRNAVIWSRGV